MYTPGCGWEEFSVECLKKTFAAMALKVNIKWGREKFQDVALDTTASPTDFMATVYSLTGWFICAAWGLLLHLFVYGCILKFPGVPVDRQKLMCRAWKRKLTGDADFSAMPKLKNGLQVWLMQTNK